MPVLITKTIPTPKGLIEFRFEPLHVEDITIFAVYCSYSGILRCFHLAKKMDNCDFKILDKHNCPYNFQNLEQLLSEAILSRSENEVNENVDRK